MNYGAASIWRASSRVAAVCYGVRFEVICPRDQINRVAECLPPGTEYAGADRVDHTLELQRAANGSGLYSVRSGDSVKLTNQGLEQALTSLSKEIHFRAAEYARSHVFIHAGVVQWKNHCLILPGSSHAGKSTLVWHLVQAGATYYSDEYAALDSNGRVHPVSLPIALRTAGGRRALIRPLEVGSKPITPDLIAFVQYRQGVKWCPLELRPVESFIQLIRHCVGIRRDPERVIPLLKQIGSHAKSFMGTRGEPAEVADWLNTLDSSYNKKEVS